MQSEIRSNGKLQIRLMANWDIERSALVAMLDAAAKGQTINIVPDREGDEPVLILSMDRQIL